MIDLLDMLQPVTHIDIIRDILKKERGMRAWVFRNRPAEQKRKVDEINTALEHLAALERILIPPARAPRSELAREEAMA